MSRRTGSLKPTIAQRIHALDRTAVLVSREAEARRHEADFKRPPEDQLESEDTRLDRREAAEAEARAERLGTALGAYSKTFRGALTALLPDQFVPSETPTRLDLRALDLALGSIDATTTWLPVLFDTALRYSDIEAADTLLDLFAVIDQLGRGYVSHAALGLEEQESPLSIDSEGRIQGRAEAPVYRCRPRLEHLIDLRYRCSQSLATALYEQQGALEAAAQSVGRNDAAALDGQAKAAEARAERLHDELGAPPALFESDVLLTAFDVWAEMQRPLQSAMVVLELRKHRDHDVASAFATVLTRAEQVGRGSSVTRRAQTLWDRGARDEAVLRLQNLAWSFVAARIKTSIEALEPLLGIYVHRLSETDLDRVGTSVVMAQSALFDASTHFTAVHASDPSTLMSLTRPEVIGRSILEPYRALISALSALGIPVAELDELVHPDRSPWTPLIGALDRLLVVLGQPRTT